jgi:hypothetical protein
VAAARTLCPSAVTGCVCGGSSAGQLAYGRALGVGAWIGGWDGAKRRWQEATNALSCPAGSDSGGHESPVASPLSPRARGVPRRHAVAPGSAPGSSASGPPAMEHQRASARWGRPAWSPTGSGRDGEAAADLPQSREWPVADRAASRRARPPALEAFFSFLWAQWASVQVPRLMAPVLAVGRARRARRRPRAAPAVRCPAEEEKAVARRRRIWEGAHCARGFDTRGNRAVCCKCSWTCTPCGRARKEHSVQAEIEKHLGLRTSAAYEYSYRFC